tara:strand:+ start:433 stop:735 length:303 start_codon:yes stop_codon:yes gene_type:complete
MKNLYIGLISLSLILFFSSFNSIKNNINLNNQFEEIFVESEFNKGFKDGWCEGWKDVKGKNSYCPYAPYAPYPKYPQKSSSYRDGYNTGFKAGRRKAQNS